MFIHSHNSILVYFLVYVDDLLIIDNSSSFIRHIIMAFSNRLSIKDLRLLHLFLGVEVITSPNWFFLSQHKYVRELLENFHMAGIKTCHLA